MGQGSGQAAKSRAEKELDEKMEKLNQAYISARKKGEQAAEPGKDEIENRPIASVGIAFLVGLVTNKLFSQNKP